ncbi:pyridine nucleotide-disulfide oxidoreductase [Actinoplanes sp. OR16]|uniref:NAD(P)/FAD-dependent oxidoreductase n=1 Tax=Actinoplanes sp. OR16 TaxID=946334 RepID=UPI000F6BB879|nr:FAD-dependent oxidoreductase [Actinoplanes sp. OR16]BBH68810.1 pyridine nucleotide-disulfide oxidoreductase [Actinoplanes sp. OR16]
MEKVGIVGASLAGLAAARALRRQSFAGEIIAIGAERHQPYDRPPLSKEFLTGAATIDDLVLPASSGDLGVTWRLGVAATRLDARNRSIHLDTGEEIRVDGVVIATGARARQPSYPGVHTLRTVDDAIALRDALKAGGKVVVIGAGFIGAEVASSARSLGLDVTVVEALPTPLAGPLGPEMGGICARLHADHGTRLLTGIPVSGVHDNQVELADGTLLPADVVVAGIGSLPNVAWLADSTIDMTNGVVIAPDGSTNLPHVVATGDCAIQRGSIRSEHWTYAVEHPKIAAATLLGTTAPAPRAPYFWSDQYGVHLQFAGHREAGDSVRIVEGDPEERSFLAVYERGGHPVAVLGMNQPRLFTQWRRRLTAVPQEA